MDCRWDALICPVPLGELKKLSEDRNLYFDQSLMSFAMGNAITLEDTNGNRKLLKKRQEEKGLSSPQKRMRRRKRKKKRCMKGQ